jgi:hypothetical protein
MNMAKNNTANDELVAVRFLKDFEGHAAGDVAEVEERLVYGLTEWEVVEVVSPVEFVPGEPDQAGG